MLWKCAAWAAQRRKVMCAEVVDTEGWKPLQKSTCIPRWCEEERDLGRLLPPLAEELPEAAGATPLHSERGSDSPERQLVQTAQLRQ